MADALIVIGGALLTISPVLVWWRLLLTTEIPEGAVVADLPSYPGVQRWPGFVAVMVGACILMMLAAVTWAKLEPVVKRRFLIAVTVLGGIGALLGLIALVLGGSLLDVPAGLRLGVGPALHLAWLGGLLALAGGSLRLSAGS